MQPYRRNLIIMLVLCGKELSVVTLWSDLAAVYMVEIGDQWIMVACVCVGVFVNVGGESCVERLLYMFCSTSENDNKEMLLFYDLS